MDKSDSKMRGYLLATLIGAIGGGVLTIAVTKAIPKIMLRTMQNMMVQMQNGSCNPEEM